MAKWYGSSDWIAAGDRIRCPKCSYTAPRVDWLIVHFRRDHSRFVKDKSVFKTLRDGSQAVFTTQYSPSYTIPRFLGKRRQSPEVNLVKARKQAARAALRDHVSRSGGWGNLNPRRTEGELAESVSAVPIDIVREERIARSQEQQAAWRAKRARREMEDAEALLDVEPDAKRVKGEVPDFKLNL